MSRLRVVAGSAGGLWIKVPKNFVSRPTQDRVKQAIFSALGSKVIGATVLEIFAGSGNLGIEALSRGAESCVFVDKAKASALTIKENLAYTRLSGTCITTTAESFTQSCVQKFDLVLAGPPYDLVPPHIGTWELLNHVAQCLNPQGIFVLEFRKQQSEWSEHPLLVPTKVLQHGQTHVAFLMLKQSNDHSKSDCSSSQDKE